jgi:uncharacterized membrane protein YbhN (UPF0104 family)
MSFARQSGRTWVMSPSTLKARIVRRLVGVGVATAVLTTLLLAIPPLQSVVTQIEHLNGWWVLAAAALELGSCVGFVVVFRLFFDELPAGRARELAWLEEGSGALLPGGGVGALAVGGWFLRKAGMSTRQIVGRSSALFFLTSAVNVGALVAAGALLAGGLVSGPEGFVLSVVPVLVGLAAIVVAVTAPTVVRRSGARWLGAVATGVDGALRAFARPRWRLLGAAAYLGLDIAALGATMAATGHPIPAAPLVLAYLIGYLANLIPIPGGFGVLEGGLAGAMIAYGAPATQAAAAVVVYHAIAFWIPSLGGLAGYGLLRRRLPEGGAAVEHKRLTVDRGRTVGREEHDRGGDLVGLEQPPERRLARECELGLINRATRLLNNPSDRPGGQLGADERRADSVDANAGAGELGRDRPRQPDRGVLGRAVGAGVWSADPARG